MVRNKNKAAILRTRSSRLLDERSSIKNAELIVIKIGSAVITDPQVPNNLSLTRITSLAEQIVKLKNSGKQVIVVCSGAVSVGSAILENEECIASIDDSDLDDKMDISPEEFQLKLCASIGQSSITAYFSETFQKLGCTSSQILVSPHDFLDVKQRCFIKKMLRKIGQTSSIIPILNTNDAVMTISEHGIFDIDGISLKDNDNLAALIARDIRADLLIILSDVDGVYTSKPSDRCSQLVMNCTREDLKEIYFKNEESSIGTGGMESKANSALWCVDHGCKVVIANGVALNDNLVIYDILEGKPVGTFFTKKAQSCRITANAVKKSQKVLQDLTFEQRCDMIRKLADLLEDNMLEILRVNKLDIDSENMKEHPNVGRLILNESKMSDLIRGIRQLVNFSDPLSNVLSKTLLDDGLVLEKTSVPLGVLLVICESRPDVPPQVASLAIASGNGLLMKGGKEACHTNDIISKYIKQALSLYNVQNSYAQITKRDEVAELLELPQFIDLIIPRGSYEMVSTIQAQSTKIQVMGHSEGICMLYIDEHMDEEVALRICVDSKCDYPSACNSVETILVHASHMKGFVQTLISHLTEHEVTVYAGKEFMSTELGSKFKKFEHYRYEYGRKALTLEVVPSLEVAIDYINAYGSSHTDGIISTTEASVTKFLKLVDSANVYHNASTRFADGYRYGLGCEVGISTNKVHARGPVGIEGLLSTKYILKGHGQVAAEYKTGAEKVYKHIRLCVEHQLN